VSHLEASLENARVALDAGDPNGSMALAQSARTTLLQHPELPQAAWLMAEALHVTAASAWALGDPTAAEDALRQSQVLEGARAAALGDAITKPSTADAELVTVKVTAAGVQPGDTLEWDGIPRDAPGRVWAVPRAPELHHARVLRQARPLWAGWVRVVEGATVVSLPLSQAEPCSVEDLALSRSPDTTSLVRCAAWVTARPAGGDAIEVAICRFARCEPFARWPRPLPAAVLRERGNPAESSSWVTPWGYTFLGVAVATAATALIWSATQSDESERTVWVYEGVR
jgi:hypothetical protein